MYVSAEYIRTYRSHSKNRFVHSKNRFVQISSHVHSVMSDTITKGSLVKDTWNTKSMHIPYLP